MANFTSAQNSPHQKLCLACGLCCNGVIFADVTLQSEDDPAGLQSLGLPVFHPRSQSGAARFNQPCVALDGCRCRIYQDRPKHCRDFSCLLLNKVKNSEIDFACASRTVAKARDQSDKVRRLLRELGDTDEAEPLSRRFRRTARRLEQVGLDEPSSRTYADLTLAVHDLNCLLRQSFYP